MDSKARSAFLIENYENLINKDEGELEGEYVLQKIERKLSKEEQLSHMARYFTDPKYHESSFNSKQYLENMSKQPSKAKDKIDSLLLNSIITKNSKNQYIFNPKSTQKMKNLLTDNGTSNAKEAQN